jgi:hypothetical protein
VWYVWYNMQQLREYYLVCHGVSCVVTCALALLLPSAPRAAPS